MISATTTLGAARRQCGAPSSSSQPVVAVGELWVLELAAGGLSRFDHSVIATANVIIYDRALAGAVEAVLPLGGYAEPASEDSPARCLQFVREGWSVVRIVDPAAGLVTEARRLSMQLRAAGAPDDLGVSRLARGSGTQPGESKGTLAGIDAVLDDIDGSGSSVLRFGAFRSSKASLHQAAASNGLAG